MKRKHDIFAGIVVDDSVSLNTYNFERNVRTAAFLSYFLKSREVSTESST